jgi:hypothetical protein
VLKLVRHQEEAATLNHQLMDPGVSKSALDLHSVTRRARGK